ncbi:MAG: glycosyltransferase [Candidatus Omnitrophica bacterium]|nr:glycosyltransferase [Candidatus Omnitrophota bacterium]
MTDEKIKLSVIIPTHNRTAILKKCLGALQKATLAADSFEVIVSDDGSNEDVKSGIGAFLDSKVPSFRYMRNEKTGANRARNLAIKESQGAILLFINDDIIAAPGMLETHMLAHGCCPEENTAILGRVRLAPEIQPTVFSNLHLDASFDLLEGREELDWRAFYTCNVSVKRSFLEKYGIFDEDMRWHEDLELAERLSRHGLRVIYNSDALGYHWHDLDENGYLAIAAKEGGSLAAWYKKAPELKKKLSLLGFYIGAPFLERIKYKVADLFINGLTMPYVLDTARFFAPRKSSMALTLYRKAFQSIKRKAIRNELYRKD